MKNKITVITFIIIIIIIFSLVKEINQGLKDRLVSPGFPGNIGQKVEPTETPTPKPREFKFDSSTNLEQELESINPEVKDQDFQ